MFFILLAYIRVKYNIGSICNNQLLCNIILYLLLSYISKLFIYGCLNGRATLSQNFSILAQAVSEIWHKTYPKNGSFCVLCCCTWNIMLFPNYATLLIFWYVFIECIKLLQKLSRIILMFGLLKLVKNCGSYDQNCKCGSTLCKFNLEFLHYVMCQQIFIIQLFLN